MFAGMVLADVAAPTALFGDLVDGFSFHETLKLHHKWRSVGAV